MSREIETRYGVGGFDPAKPNSNIVGQVEVDAPDPTPTAEERVAQLEAEVDALTEALMLAVAS